MNIEISDCIGGSAKIDSDGTVEFKPESKYINNKEQIDLVRTQRETELLGRLVSLGHISRSSFSYLVSNSTQCLISLLVVTNSSNITAFAEEPTETSESEFDKIKQRSKLSAKGKSPYGPQRR